jgi:hypothetical protein
MVELIIILSIFISFVFCVRIIQIIQEKYCERKMKINAQQKHNELIEHIKEKGLVKH